MALTADRNTPYKGTGLVSVPVAAGARIFAGALVVANANGYAAPGTTSTTVTYLGRAEQGVDNTSGGNGAVSVNVRRAHAFRWKNSAADAVTQAELGKVVYIVDDETVAKTNGGNTRSAAGKVVEIDDAGVWVE